MESEARLDGDDGQTASEKEQSWLKRIGLAKFDDPEEEKGFQEHYYASGRTLLIAASIMICLASMLISLREFIYETLDNALIFRHSLRATIFILALITLLSLLRRTAPNIQLHRVLQISMSIALLVVILLAGYAFKPYLTIELYYRGIAGQIICLITISALIRIPAKLLVVEIGSAIACNWWLTSNFKDSNERIWVQGQVFLACTIFLSALIYSAQQILERRVYKSKILLKKQVTIAANASAEKSRFLAALSHDLRQPLTGLVGYLDLVKSKIVGQPETEISLYLERAQNSASAIQNNLTRVLEIARLQDFDSSVKLEVLDIQEVLNNIGALYEAQLITESIRLKIIQPMAGVAFVKSDFDLVFQILQNLVANAIKYRRANVNVSSMIIISIAHLSTGQTKLSIVDNGIGIPKDQINLIFKAYYQINNPARESTKGLGLGLAFVWDAVKKLEGHSISVWSNGQSITKFNLQIPTERLSGPLPPVRFKNPSTRFKQDPRFVGLILLIIEDNQYVRDFVVETVQMIGGIALAFTNPNQSAESGRDLSKVNIIICDYNLPGGTNGYQFVLKERSKFQALTPGLIITGNTQVRMPKNSANFEILFKPFSAQQLIAALVLLEPRTR